MLWSLIKILAFVLGVTALTYGAMELSQIQGEVLITFAGLEMRLGPLELAFALVGMVVLTWVMFKLLGMLVAFLKFLNGDETAVSRYFTRNRVERGYQALTEGMMAVASGEGHLALAKAAKAEKLLDKPELTTLLIAQAAEVAGDQKKAEAAYKLLLTEDRTRFVGIRGLMQQKLAAGDTETALKLAQKAFELKPKHEATQDTLLKLQADSGDWTGARATLAAKAKSGGLPKDVLRRRDAVLALSEAKDLINEESSI
ncbi:MAG: heme biosynthesis protein HemY, partial [Marivivens sp.]|nr:heme biosynthesis protein HemY [Marivivens sp.]